MPHDSSSNAPSSATTSTSARTSRPSDATRKELSELGEAQFLTRQAADAKSAISRVVSDLQHDLQQTVDPRAWMQVHPWATMGAGAIAGFVAAALAVPSKEQQTLRRLKKIEEALTPDRPVEPASNGDSAHAVSKGRGSFLSDLAGQVLRAVQPVLMSAITAGVTAKSVKDKEPTGGTDPGASAAGENSPASTGADPQV